jgi:hypothetical protein
MKCQCLKDEKKREKQYREKRPWWKVILGYCPYCGRYFKWRITTERRLTQYCDEKQNYMTACKECHADDNDYYEELWREYNAGRL